jgi:hypothetical protein
MAGGFAFTFLGRRLSSSDALRPLIVAVIAAAIYAAASGAARVRADLDALHRRLTPTIVAAALTGGVLVVGIANNSWSVGASDSYSYVSQADLWLRGNLKVPVPIADAAPWPNALSTFTPFGYSPVPDATAIAPMTGPGLPLLMAAFKRVAGHPAAFLVAPLAGALLVWTTFFIGRRLGSDGIGRRVARCDEPDVPDDVQVADERRPCRCILGAGDVLDSRPDRSQRSCRRTRGINGDPHSPEPCSDRRGNRGVGDSRGPAPDFGLRDKQAGAYGHRGPERSAESCLRSRLCPAAWSLPRSITGCGARRCRPATAI